MSLAASRLRHVGEQQRADMSTGKLMGKHTAAPVPTPTHNRACTEPFKLCELRENKNDKLGHNVLEIILVGRNYAIYRAEKGIYVQFSDDEKEEADQRLRFSEICPELCELRYFTSQMQSSSGLPFHARHDAPSLFDHNIAQAIWLVMENRVDLAKPIAQQALRMAVGRATNDNTIRYMTACLSAWLVCIVALAAFRTVAPYEVLGLYAIAGIFGATGAVLSIATRLQAFQLQPCNQSNMNYWMSAVRVGIGVVAGMVFLLFAPLFLAIH
jgi:hypothetical protein